MKLIILNQHFAPEVAATSQLLADLVDDLTAHNISITVVVGMPSYLSETSLPKLPKTENYKSITVHRVYTTACNRQKRFGRMVNYLSFYFFAFWKVLRLSKPDIIISMSTPPYLSLIAVILKKIKKCKFIYWVQDVYPDLAIAFGFLPEKNFVVSLLKKISQRIYQASDQVVVIGTTMAEMLEKEHHVEKKKIRIIENWADPADFLGEEKENPLRLKLGLQSRFVILYSGNMGVVHDFNIVKQAMLSYEAESQIAFVFIGDGAKKADLEHWKDSHHLQNVFFLPYQPREMLRYSMKLADAFLITMDERSKGMVVPSKLYAGLAIGRPIVAVGPPGTELEKVIKDYQCGICVEGHDLDGFLQGIQNLRTQKAFYTQCAKNALTTFDTFFSRKRATEKFFHALQEVCP